VKIFQKISFLITVLVTFFISSPSLLSEESLEKLPEIKLDYIGEEPELKDRPILLEFWATWCPPCRKSIPHLNEIHKKFSPQGLLIIAITDEEKPLVRKFSSEHDITYKVAIDDKDTLAKHFNVKGIPHAVLADKSGRIIWKGHPAQLTDDIIIKAL
jgi:thiol-disulfide isomerase/thioredoxin